MACRLRRIVGGPTLWACLSVLLGAFAGVCYGLGYYWWCGVAFLVALWSAVMVIKYVNRLRSNVNYIFSASVNGDFSYKFPLNGVGQQEHALNSMLNLIVEHLESISDKARQAEVFLGVVINMMDTGIIVADSRGRVVHCNRAALSLLSVPVLTDIRALPAVLPGIEVKKTTTMLHGDRVEIYTLNDVSHVVQNAEVESWERLTRVLTHEIMNSLTPVNSIADSLSLRLKEGQDMAADSDFIHQIDVIKSSNRSLMEFVRNFRKITLLPEPKPQVIYIKPFLEKTISLAKALDGADSINFRLSVFPPDTMAYTDENLLSRVLVNLLKNAVEAKALTIEIETAIRGDEGVEIAVSNDGEPIPATIASQIFTPFFTTKSGGSGIGLSLSRRIIAKLGGTLTLSSNPYTRFVIIL